VKLIFRALFDNSFRLAENRWTCTNCGHHFYTKWYKLIFAPSAALETPALKCPKCKTKDMCSIVRN